ncbi:MAG: hypothetical protein LBT71_03280 [Azoarcus sp.]|jgi:hypothetical protein|nr:hypothetical protein [Azoarcus sp.]
MRFQTFDKAKWHYGAVSAPADIPCEFGATHIAFFLRWCVEQDFMSKETIEECGKELEAIKNKTLDCREFFMEMLDGALTSEDFNTKGGYFASAYYGNDKTKFAKKYGTYLDNYDTAVKSTLKTAIERLDDNAYFFVENSEENYEIVKKIIDKRYEQFLLMKESGKKPKTIHDN